MALIFLTKLIAAVLHEAMIGLMMLSLNAAIQLSLILFTTTHLDDTQDVDGWSSLNRCGPLALQVCCKSIGKPVKDAEMSKLLPRDGKEVTIGQLRSAAEQIGVQTFACRWSKQSDGLIVSRDSPAIIPITHPSSGSLHFVVAIHSFEDRILVADFPSAPKWITNDELVSQYKWDGTALYVSATAGPLIWLRILSSGAVAPLLSLALGVALPFVVAVIKRWKENRLESVRVETS